MRRRIVNSEPLGPPSTAKADALVSGAAALSGMIIGMFLILFVLMKVDGVPKETADNETRSFMASLQFCSRL